MYITHPHTHTHTHTQGLLTFPELRDVVGFDDYYAEEERYKLK